MTSSFWFRKRVLLTGHTGFKGAWLAWWLNRLGADVTGYALPPPRDGRPNLSSLLKLEQYVRSTLGDIRAVASLEATVDECRPDIVFHLAAQALVRESYDNPAATFETNVVGTANVLDVVRKASSVGAIVVVTSDKCYQNVNGRRPHRETDPLGGSDPYSASKAAQEIVSEAYRMSYFQNGPLLATVRAGNVIGGGDWAVDRLVPDLVQAMSTQSPLHLRYPNAIRPWQHVLEPLSAYLLIAERLYAGERQVAEAWNIGPSADDHRPVSEVVSIISAAWGLTEPWTQSGEPFPPEAAALSLDASKAARLLGIYPRFGLTMACDRTALWYRSWTKGCDAGTLCNADIDCFEAMSCQN